MRGISCHSLTTILSFCLVSEQKKNNQIEHWVYTSSNLQTNDTLSTLPKQLRISCSKCLVTFQTVSHVHNMEIRFIVTDCTRNMFVCPQEVCILRPVCLLPSGGGGGLPSETSLPSEGSLPSKGSALRGRFAFWELSAFWGRCVFWVAKSALWQLEGGLQSGGGLAPEGSLPHARTHSSCEQTNMSKTSTFQQLGLWAVDMISKPTNLSC